MLSKGATFLVGQHASVSAYLLCILMVDGKWNDVDFMAYSRGSRDDFNRWAKTTSDERWSWESLFPFMLKVITENIYGEV